MLNLYQCTVRTYIDGEKVYVCDGGKKMCGDCSLFIRRPDIKEWRAPKLNISFEAKWDKINPSINDVVNWHDGEQAIQYLVSRVLAIK